jgi:uncharacterized protein YdaU (DUF1376 family)
VSPKVWARRWSVLSPFFVETEGGITHKRVTAESEKVTSIRAKRSAAGDAGAKAKALKSKKTAQANASETDKQTAKQNGHIPESIARKREKDKPSLSTRGGAAKEAKAKGSKRKPETTLPEGYPDAAAIADGQDRFRKAGLDLCARHHAERFRNHAAQTDRRCRDWGAAWRNWVLKQIGDAPKKAPAAPVAPAPAAVFSGPPELRADVVAMKGEPWTRNYLDRCTWRDVPRRALITTNSLVVDTLRRELGRTLSAHGVTVLLEKGEAA